MADSAELKVSRLSDRVRKLLFCCGSLPKQNGPTQQSMALRRIHKEIKDLRQSPQCICSVQAFDDDDMYHWTLRLVGPASTPYSGGVFSLDIKYPPSYPFKPPEVRFTTPIYHVNISLRGTPHLFILKDNWSPALSISSVVLAIEGLLEEPNPDNSGDNLEAAMLCRHDRRVYEETALDWTRRYAGLTEQHDEPVS